MCKGQSWWVTSREVFSRHTGAVEHMTSQHFKQCIQSLYKLKPDKLVWSAVGRCESPPLPEALLVFDSCWERESSFLS